MPLDNFDIRVSGFPGPQGAKGDAGERPVYATWAALSAVTGTAGASAEVPDSDTGTHADPVTAATVANGGIYSWSMSPAGWQRVVDTDALSAKPYADAAATSASNAAADAASVSGVSSLFVTVTSDNLFDPATGVDGSSYNASGGTGAVARYGRLPLPVVAGQTYTVSVSFASSDWKLNQTNFVNFYNSAAPSAGSLISSSAPGTNGVSFSADGRTVTFTAPAGATYAGINAYNAVNAAPSAADFDDLWGLTMANTGATAQPFSAYAAGTKDFPDSVKNVSAVSVTLDGVVAYVRQPDWRSATQSFIRKISIGDVPGPAEAGTIDFLGQSAVLRSYAPKYSKAAYNAGTALWASSDNGPPIKINNMYLAGGHGVSASYKLTIAGHGLTNVNVGDVGTVGAASWVLVRIDDANTITVMAANTGASETLWTITGALAAAGTITFAAAGTKNWTAATATQLWPLAQNYSAQFYVDGEAVSGDGTYEGNEVVLREKYGVPNPANWLATLIAQKGTATPKALNDPAIATQVEIDQAWRFDRYGSMVGTSSFFAKQQFALQTSSSYDYIGGWQHQSITKGAGYTLHQYVGGLIGPVGGYDFSALADVTANAATVTPAKTDWADATNPPAEFAQVVKQAGAPLVGLAMGYLRTIGAGKPPVRSLNNKVWQLSNAEKQYPVLYDGGHGTPVAAGAVIAGGFWDAAYTMDAHPTHTIDSVFEWNGKIYRVLVIHATVTNYTVAMPDEAIGRPITVLDKSSSLTLHTAEMVPAGGVVISTTGGHGRMVLEIG